MNLFIFANNAALDDIDMLGLWHANVHRDLTRELALDLGYSLYGGAWIGLADNQVDSVWNPMTGLTDDNWQYHFDRSTGGMDTRLVKAEEWRVTAFDLCDWVHKGNDDSVGAAQAMGYSLHPAQDYVAHGDYNRKVDLPNPSAWPPGFLGRYRLHMYHNWDAPGSGTANASLPDDIEKDALVAPDFTTPTGDGRPLRGTAGNGMSVGTTCVGAGTTYWTKYTVGTKRKKLTENITKVRLIKFQQHVRENGLKCGQCQREFGAIE
jgi:hypothetical protein